MEGTKEKRTRRTRLLLALALVLALASAAAWLLLTVRIGPRRYRRAELIDVRAAELKCEEYDAAAASLPSSVIRWSVPIGGARYDSFSEEITLSSLPADEVGRLGYFPKLKTIDASLCGDWAALAAAARAYPALHISWRVPTADGEVDGNAESLAVRSLSSDELRELIGLLPRLECVDLTGSTLEEEEIDRLVEDFPSLRFRYPVDVWGTAVMSDTSELTLPAGAAGDPAALGRALGRLGALERLDLRGADLSPRELAALLPLCPADTRYDILLLGRRFASDSEEIDLSGTPVSDTAEIEAAAGLMPRLKKVVMCDCGLPDEEMDALDRRHASVRFVWAVHFSVYTLRTDATVFCASDLPNRGYIAPQASSEELSALRYCRDLVALDLGHMMFRDLGFLEGLTHLKYLILVEERFHDISVLGKMQELEYLEIFNNTIDDISPLLNCKALRHLNVGYTRGYDPAPLGEMTWLERLWYPGNRIEKSEREAIVASLSDTKCYFPTWDEDGSTGGGWRTDEAYYEMRNAFGMFYQPGGTGTGKTT